MVVGWPKNKLFQDFFSFRNIKKKGNWSHMLHVKCNTSCFRCHMSVILCCMSPVTCHLSQSHETCYMSPVTCHLSHVTCYISLILIPKSPTLHSRMVDEHSQTKLSPFLLKTAVPQPIMPFSYHFNINFTFYDLKVTLPMSCKKNCKKK